MLQFTFIHDGIVPLLRKISDLQLRLLFVTSRPVDIMFETRRFLLEVGEADKTLPESPLFMNPDPVMEAFYREVIMRNSAGMKASLLANVSDTFNRAGRNSCPFILGFGNRKSDADAYSKSGILPEYIFIIDTSSTLTAVEGGASFQTYKDPNLLALIDQSFSRPGNSTTARSVEASKSIAVASSETLDDDSASSEPTILVEPKMHRPIPEPASGR